MLVIFCFRFSSFRFGYDFFVLCFNVITGFSLSKSRREDMIKEMYYTGAQSVMLVFWGGLFVGIILALETGHRFASFGAKTMVGRTVMLGVIRELGPVISGLLLAARTGAKNASEIGSMKISEQIDALKAYGMDPVYMLVSPRTAAALIMFVPLVLIADFAGILGGMLISNLILSIDPVFFWNSGLNGLQMKDLFVGFTKPIFFGFFISAISCFYGLTTRGGTTGVGRSTINSVVVSSLVVLIIDVVFTKIVWEVL
jgi:phospholipid/cholesterol/gamma-HCH transport system permease protein